LRSTAQDCPEAQLPMVDVTTPGGANVVLVVVGVVDVVVGVVDVVVVVGVDVVVVVDVEVVVVGVDVVVVDVEVVEVVDVEVVEVVDVEVVEVLEVDVVGVVDVVVVDVEDTGVQGVGAVVVVLGQSGRVSDPYRAAPMARSPRMSPTAMTHETPAACWAVVGGQGKLAASVLPLPDVVHPGMVVLSSRVHVGVPAAGGPVVPAFIVIWTGPNTPLALVELSTTAVQLTGTSLPR